LETVSGLKKSVRNQEETGQNEIEKRACDGGSIIRIGGARGVLSKRRKKVKGKRQQGVRGQQGNEKRVSSNLI